MAGIDDGGSELVEPEIEAFQEALARPALVRLAAVNDDPLAAVEPEPMIDADEADRIVADRIYRLAALSEEEAAAAEPKCGR